MGTGDVREDDVRALREVLASLRRHASTVGDDGQAPRDLGGPGVRWRALDLLRDLLRADVIWLEGLRRGHTDPFFVQALGPGGPGGPVVAEPRLRCVGPAGPAPRLCDTVVMEDRIEASAELDEHHSLRVAAVLQPPGDAGPRECGLLRLLLPHIVDAWHRSWVPDLPLTEAQQRVLELVGDGLTNRQVARHLGVSESTVRTHLQNVYAALGVHSRAAAVAAGSGGAGVVVPAQRRGAGR